MTYLAPPNKYIRSTDRAHTELLVTSSCDIPTPDTKGGVTMATVIKAAWTLCLAQQTQTHDVAFAQLVRNRHLAVATIERTVGPCINYISVRVPLKLDWTVEELLHWVQRQHIGTMTCDTADWDDLVIESTSWPHDTEFGSAVHHLSAPVAGDYLSPRDIPCRFQIYDFKMVHTYPMSHQCKSRLGQEPKFTNNAAYLTMGPSKLKAALAREKGVDYKKIKQKKKYKEAIKNKRKKAEKNGGAAARGDSDDSEDDDWEDEDHESDEGGAAVEDGDEEEEDEHVDWQALDESDSSGSEVELEEKIERKPKSILKAKNVKADTEAEASKKGKKEEAKDEDEEEEEEEDEEDIPMSDLEDLPEEEREDLVPHTRLTINNTSALLSALNRIAIPTDASAPFATHQSVTSEAPTADGIEDIQDDLARELAFYAQSLDAAKRGRALLKAEGVPFSRPTDYFAEMVKDDSHMEKIKAKLIEEASAKKASAEARKLRDLKKFGKQVQVAKLQERQKAKKETLEKIKSLKRKRQESSGDLGTNEADLFDVGVDHELNAHKSKASSGRNGGDREQHRPNAKRQKKNEKYGFGGKKRHAKSGDAVSTGDMSGFSARRMKTGSHAKVPKTARLGKSRRKAAGAGKR
ncbi:hypothetical protein DL768_000806 [Monosporascus sp. mg162]|nr:hypothetical protein DL768_000806 [Monosporascus sp. mg162]